MRQNSAEFRRIPPFSEDRLASPTKLSSRNHSLYITSIKTIHHIYVPITSKHNEIHSYTCLNRLFIARLPNIHRIALSSLHRSTSSFLQSQHLPTSQQVCVMCRRFHISDQIRSDQTRVDKTLATLALNLEAPTPPLKNWHRNQQLD